MQRHFSMICILAGISILLSGFLPASGSTWTSPADYSVETEINFDTAENMELIGLWMDDPSKVDPASLIKDGVFRIGGGTPFNGIQIHPTFKPGYFVQVRLRISQKVCFPVQMNMSSNKPDEGEELIRVDGCPLNKLNGMLVHNVPNKDSLFARLKLSGKTMVKPGDWMDVIFWLHPDGDKAFVFTGDGQDFAYGSIALPVDWQTNDAHLQVAAWTDSKQDYVELDLIRWGQGSIKDYLETYLPEYITGKTIIDPFLEEQPQAFPEFSTKEPMNDEPDQPQEEQDKPQGDQNQPDLSDPYEVMKTFLNDPVLKFNENVDGMKQNNGGQFGPGSKKTVPDGAAYMSFTGQNDKDGIWTPLNTPLDQFDKSDKPGGNQAIFFKFQALPPEYLYFTFMGPQEFNIDFWEGGKPRINWLAEFKNAPMQSKSFTIEKGIWYFMLMAMDKNGKFTAAIWEADNYKNMTIFFEDFSTHPGGEKYKNASWKFILGSNEPMTINLENYRVLSFGSINENIFNQ